MSDNKAYQPAGCAHLMTCLCGCGESSLVLQDAAGKGGLEKELSLDELLNLSSMILEAIKNKAEALQEIELGVDEEEEEQDVIGPCEGNA